jgi:hypothetical protein
MPECHFSHGSRRWIGVEMANIAQALGGLRSWRAWRRLVAGGSAARSKIIADGTNWRFRNELKRELKAWATSKICHART